jgi:hypothetical protein
VAKAIRSVSFAQMLKELVHVKNPWPLSRLVPFFTRTRRISTDEPPTIYPALEFDGLREERWRSSRLSSG